MVARFLELGGGGRFVDCAYCNTAGQNHFPFFFLPSYRDMRKSKKIAEKWQSLCLEEARGG